MARGRDHGTLAEMLRDQGLFSDSVQALKDGEKATGVERTTHWAQTYILAAHAELSELLETLPKWKPHRRNLVEAPFNRDAFLEEGVDVFNYLISALLLHDVTADEFYTIWRGKLDVLLQRQYQEVTSPLQAGDRVVMLDLDGVLADYRTALLNYSCQMRGVSPINDTCVHYALERELAVPPDVYRRHKELFVAEGGLRTVPTFANAEQIVAAARGLGRIVFVSSREGDSDRQIYRDTLSWLRELVGDTSFTLHFTRNKAEWLAGTGVELVAAVEDEPKTAQRLAAQFTDDLGGVAPVIVPAWGYNEELEDDGHVKRMPLGLVAEQLQALRRLRPVEPTRG